MRLSKTFFFILLIFFFSFLNPFDANGDVGCELVDENLPDSALQSILQKCEIEIELQTGLVRDKQREATNLERDLSILDHQMQKARAEIKARQISIYNLDREIDKKSQNIVDLSGKIGVIKSSIAELVRRTNRLESTSIVEIFLGNRDLSDFFVDIGSFDFLRASLRTAFGEVVDTRGKEEEAKGVLALKIEDERHLKNLQEIEERKLRIKEDEKARILKETKGEERAYQVILNRKQQIVADIKNRIFKTTGGTELRFEEALELVRVAERAIGLRAALILAVLTQESGQDGLIGKNLGQCFYNTPAPNNSGTVMSDQQKESFLWLMGELGREPSRTPVSCPIVSAGAYGGAMGPAQFMPNTWWDVRNGTGYKKRVEKVTKDIIGNPFNNLHAFTGAALYLGDAMIGCERTYKTVYSRESCAAAKYFAGGNWRKHMNGYGASVANRAAAFQKDIDILDSQ